MINYDYLKEKMMNMNRILLKNVNNNNSSIMRRLLSVKVMGDESAFKLVHKVNEYHYNIIFL